MAVRAHAQKAESALIWKRLLFVPALAVGIGAFAFLSNTADEPLAPQEAAAIPVRTVTVAPAAVEGRAQGYGRVRAVRRWEGVSEVNGRIVTLSDAVNEGSFLAGGTVYARVDPRDYEIARDRAHAALTKARAALMELNANEDAARANLALEERVTALAEADYQRKKRLVDAGTSPQVTLDQSERDFVSQQRRVQDLQNQLALLEVQEISMEADIQSRLVELEEAERNLANTVLRVPFDGRVMTKNIEVGEYIREGTSLIEIDDTSAAEVTAEIQPSALYALAQIADGVASFRPAALGDSTTVSDLVGALDIRASVIQTLGGQEVRWPAQVVRSDGSVDESTGTMGIVVRVDDPQRHKGQDRGPRLDVGTFVQVELTTPPAIGLIAIPREAVRTGEGNETFVYLAKADDTLARRDISVTAPVGERVVVKGLFPGDRLLLSTPQPPVLGMALRPIPADAADRSAF